VSEKPVIKPVYRDRALRCSNCCPCQRADKWPPCLLMGYAVDAAGLCEPAVVRMAQAIREIEGIMKKWCGLGVRAPEKPLWAEIAVREIDVVLARLREQVRYT
jgi:hypothetical protein